MKKQNNDLVLCQEDYDILLSYLRGGQYLSSMDKDNADVLFGELKKATLVKKEQFPADVVRLNSLVKIKELDKDKVMEFRIVTPDQADIKSKKISVMAPVGTALIGYRKGKTVMWKVPAGNRNFMIMDVENMPA